MHLYTGLSSDFIAQTATSALTERLASSFEQHYRRKPPDSEVRAWQNSLARFAHVLELGDLRAQGVIVEYQLPLTSKRLDVMVTGKNAAGDANGVIVELKQWDSVETSEIDDCVETFVGGAVRAQLHPSRQAGNYQQYLQDTHTAFSDGAVGVKACSYLHNMARPKADALFDDRFHDLVLQYPTYIADGLNDLTNLLVHQTGGGDGDAVLAQVIEGRYRPHQRLMNHIADIIQSDSRYTLLDEQQVAANHIIARARASHMGDDRSVFIIEGGPGTGKSLIALHVLAAMAKLNLTANHATGSKAFTENLRKSLGVRARALFHYFNNYTAADEMLLDVLILDEAHRIRQTSNTRFTSAAKKSEIPQVDEIIKAAKVSVFFIDDMQVVRPGEVGSTELIRDAARRSGAHLYEHELEAQFRCNGSDGFIEWVNNTLEIERTGTVLWERDDPFDVDVVDSPEELEAIIRSRNTDHETARLVAGFCWKWSAPDDVGNLIADVAVDGWSMPWNADPNAKRLAAGIPKSNFWATDPGGINQVGCVYTAQGFEFDHVGVIWGKDLVHRAREGWVAQSEFSQDSVVKKAAKKHPEEFRQLVAHTYRVLLTRGMRSCTMYFEDEETRNFVLSRFSR